MLFRRIETCFFAAYLFILTMRLG